MSEFILIGRGEQILQIDAENWRRHLEQKRHTSSKRLDFMTPDHHRVRNFAVSELPRNFGNPLSAQTISTRLDIPLDSVYRILDDLQQHLVFVVQNAAREVCWAYPVTTEQTPHRLRFSTGERILAACAEDVMATPFVQGQLRNEKLSVEIETVCVHCEQPMHLTVNSDLQWSVREQDASPLLFEPEVDLEHFNDATIIDAY